jgi:hypothetical protein
VVFWRTHKQTNKALVIAEFQLPNGSVVVACRANSTFIALALLKHKRHSSKAQEFQEEVDTMFMIMHRLNLTCPFMAMDAARGIVKVLYDITSISGTDKQIAKFEHVRNLKKGRRIGNSCFLVL